MMFKSISCVIHFLVSLTHTRTYSAFSTRCLIYSQSHFRFLCHNLILFLKRLTCIVCWTNNNALIRFNSIPFHSINRSTGYRFAAVMCIEMFKWLNFMLMPRVRFYTPHLPPPRSCMRVSICMRACSILSNHTATDITKSTVYDVHMHNIFFFEWLSLSHTCITSTQVVRWMMWRRERERENDETKNPDAQVQIPHRQQQRKKTVAKSINLIGNLEKLIYDKCEKGAKCFKPS